MSKKINKIIESLDELQEFLECDLWTKFKPLEIVDGKMFKRQDFFETEEDMIKYLRIHFDICKKQIEKSEKDYNDKLNNFVKRIKSRCCCPNKPLNTFEYAREIEEVIDEELEEF